jgi:hypothetical protein
MDATPLSIWHRAVKTHDLAPFEAILDDDAVFKSPAVHTPQAGKAKVSTYLRAAMGILNNDTFHYVAEWHGKRSAVLEFELTLEGLDVDGVDIITWNDAGRIVEFKVMVRPLKALTLLVAHMGERLRGAVAT